MKLRGGTSQASLVERCGRQVFYDI
jgi:hypothetical protein